MRTTRLLLVITLFASDALGQQAGTVQSYKAIQKSKRIMEADEDAREASKHAKMWAAVKDADQFVNLCARLRREETAKLYAAREKARREKHKPKDVATSVARLNTSIVKINDPTQAWVPDPPRPDIPDHALESAKKRVHFEAIEDRLKRNDDVRSWATRDGKTIDGALVLYDLGKVTLQSMDGKQTVLKLVDLSPVDWDYVAANTPAPKRRGG